MSGTVEYWKKCNSCKKPIGFDAIYWVCNVSTCNRARTGLSFCSVGCWDAHLPMMRHRESWAVESRSPAKGAAPGPAIPAQRQLREQPQPPEPRQPREPEAVPMAPAPVKPILRKR